MALERPDRACPWEFDCVARLEEGTRWIKTTEVLRWNFGARCCWTRLRAEREEEREMKTELPATIYEQWIDLHFGTYTERRNVFEIIMFEQN